MKLAARADTTAVVGAPTVASDGAVEAAGLRVRIEQTAGSPTVKGKSTVFDGRQVDHVIRTLEGGDTQFLSVLASPRAPKSLSYQFEGKYLELTSQGMVIVRNDGPTGEPVAMIDPAWAKDANGKPVTTRFEVSGTRLTQIVETTPTTRFPVVADPRVRPAWYGISIDFKRNETILIAGGVASCIPIVQSVPHPAAKAAAGIGCATITGVAAAAAAKDKCLSVKLSIPVGLWAPWVANCYA